MFGRLIGKIISTPVRLLNVPVKVFDKMTDALDTPLKYRDPLKLGEIADAIDDACDDD